MTDAVSLTALQTFLWGCVGGGAAYLLVFALPELRKLWNVGPPFPTAGRIVVAILLATVYVMLGGVAAVIVGDAVEVKHAIAYGLGFEALLGGVLRG